MNARETAWRVFAGELNSSSLEIKSEEEKSPSYLITPLGAKLNRILIAGVLLDKENTGTEEEPMWRGRIQDVSGNFFINVGRFQPNAAASMADLEAPSYVAVVGKVRTYTADDGRVFVTVRPETITNIDEKTRNLWVLEAAQSTWDRLVKMKDALR
ncbi:MAG: glycerol dehydrogenase, partial [Candidatus Methanomethylophilaceae archaeon]|nr:glycerol dehydrogenase [Candidatus Methanomethylophilaceae archaeon]